jgi:hypothetical protein
MKRLILAFMITFLAYSSHAQESTKYHSKVETLDSTLKTLYAVISGDKGVERDWDLFRYLFHPDAKLIPSGENKEGKINARFITPEEYVENSGKWLVENEFHEIEISRKNDIFSSVTHVFSTYEAKHSQSDPEPFMRGINSIKLLNDGSRWWILNIYWRQEGPNNPIPKKYLSN